MLDKGILVISQEIELAWGVHQTGAYHELSSDGKRERKALSLLLQIYREYDVSITWGIVGHLFLERCNGKHPVPHTPDWYKDDPATSLKDAPLWYGKDMIEKILNDPQKHEIGCHSFSHVPFNSCSREVAEYEIEQCVKIAQDFGIKLKSFIFPYNLAAHFDLLEKHGFISCRTLSLKASEGSKKLKNRRRLESIKSVIYKNLKKVIYNNEVSSHKYKNLFIKLANNFNLFLNCYPIPIYLPTRILGNLHGIPLSKHLPLSEDIDLLNQLKIKRVKQAIDKAIERREILHLWSHLRDFKKRKDFENLREVAQYATERRKNGQLLILPMRSIIENGKFL